MNIKYEHLGIAFLIFLVFSGVWFWVSSILDNSLHYMQIKCDNSAPYLIPSDADMFCKFPDNTSGFAKITYRASDSLPN